MAEQPVTGGAIAPAAPGFHGTPVGADEPNGLFLGPIDDPDRFELFGPGHVGGEGTTWRGRFRGKLNKPVLMAVKQLRPPPLASAAWPTPGDLQRWTDQRHLLQTVTHDHLVRVHDVFLSSAAHPRGVYADLDGLAFTLPCLVMEWVEGQDLRRVIQSGAPGLAERLAYIRDIAAAVAALHSATRTSGNPMLHRDVKPENVIVTADRGAVLVDIGTLRPLDGGRDPQGMHSRHYAAPEAFADLGAPRTTAYDVYGVGALAYFCLVGSDPPAADEPGAPATIRAELGAAARRWRLHRPGRVADHLAAALAPDPRQRPSRPVLWADALLACVADQPRRTRRGALVSAVVGVCAVGLVAATVPEALGVPWSDGLTRPAAAFAPFGQSYAAFAATVDGDRLAMTPPLGDDRFDHLWGFYSPGEACAATVEFDVSIDVSAQPRAFGIAVAPRAGSEADQITGSSVQYEWEDVADFGVRGSFARPVELPGGAWRASTAPVGMPDIRSRRHVVVRAIGTSMTIDVDGTSAVFDAPGVECGGIGLRAWGAPAEFSHVAVRST